MENIMCYRGWKIHLVGNLTELLKKLFCIMKLKIRDMNFLKLFEYISYCGTRRWLLTNCLLFFVWTGTMFPFLQSSGKLPALRQFWNIISRGFIIDGLLSFSILMEIKSYLSPLFVSKAWIIVSIFSLSKVISHNLFYVWYVLDFGKLLFVWYRLILFSKKVAT